jgi:adenylyl-sulfate kinase
VLISLEANIVWQLGKITKVHRANALKQKAQCIWLTGLSGSGKSTLAQALEIALHENGHHVYILDGDNVRHGLNSDLGFSDTDRVENIRRIAEVAHLMVDAGLIVIVAFISPFRADREFARQLFESNEFLEVFVNTPLELCERRDIKGLYLKARLGEIKNFTGISSPYEPPENPDVKIDGSNTIENCIDEILIKLNLFGVR